VAKRKMM